MLADTHLTQSTQAHWVRGRTMINIRCAPEESGMNQAIGAVLGLQWPIAPCSTVSQGPCRGVWAGPDDAFALGPDDVRTQWLTGLRQCTAGHHAAVTDVSSGYAVLQLSGPGVRDLLAQGCPMDLHPRVFKMGDCVGTNFFKASVWMWQTAQDQFEMLVRSSFTGYVQSLLNKCATQERLIWS